MLPKLYIIVPCYNEETVLPITAPLFLKQLKSMIDNGKISPDSRIMFVNDGSKDKTWDIICDLARNDDYFCGISQSRNRGHQNALIAGLMESKDNADITITIDCDGQDDIGAMDEMVDNYSKGFEIVYGVRSDRATDTFFKKFTAEGFYKFLALMGVEVVFNHADYRLVSSRVLKELANFKEVNLFLRGMFPLVGFKSTTVYYERHERLAGKSHYSFGKMLSLAFDGITSLSIKPIRTITFFGGLLSFLSFIALIVLLILTFVGKTVSGLSYLSGAICLIGGIQLISIGVIGEYIGKVYLEVKQRPRYIISDKTENLE